MAASVLRVPSDSKKKSGCHFRLGVVKTSFLGFNVWQCPVLQKGQLHNRPVCTGPEAQGT